MKAITKKATGDLERGIAVKAVSRYVGHSSTAITQDLYVHIDVVEEDLVDLWGDK